MPQSSPGLPPLRANAADRQTLSHAPETFVDRIEGMVREPFSRENIATFGSITGGLAALGAGVSSLLGHHHLAVTLTEAAGILNATSGVAECAEHFSDRDEKFHVNEGLADARAIGGIVSGLGVAALASSGFAPVVAIADSALKVAHHAINGHGFHTLHPAQNPAGSSIVASVFAGVLKAADAVLPGAEFAAGLAEMYEGATYKTVGNDNLMDSHHAHLHPAVKDRMVMALVSHLDTTLDGYRPSRDRDPLHIEHRLPEHPSLKLPQPFVFAEGAAAL